MTCLWLRYEHSIAHSRELMDKQWRQHVCNHIECKPMHINLTVHHRPTISSTRNRKQSDCLDRVTFCQWECESIPQKQATKQQNFIFGTITEGVSDLGKGGATKDSVDMQDPDWDCTYQRWVNNWSPASIDWLTDWLTNCLTMQLGITETSKSQEP